MRALVDNAIERLCAAFEAHGYNPTPILDLGVLVANADGTVDESERAMLTEIFTTLLETKITTDIVDHLVTASIEVIHAAGASPRIRNVGAILRDCEASADGLTVALAVAFASKGFSSKERDVIEELAGAAGIDSEKLAALVLEVKSQADALPESARAKLTSVSPE